jgi:hypothetical protein
MYNDKKNQMDLVLLFPKTMVSIEFFLEPGFPIPEVTDEFWG